MTDDTPYTGPDLTAAELALGLLEGNERAAALRRVIADPAFARDVEDWRRRLEGLFEDYAEVPAPDALLRRLAKPEPAAARRWPIVAALSAMAASLALFTFMRPQPPAPIAPAPHLMAASLMLADKSAAVPVVIDLATGQVRVTGAALAPKGKTAELWLIGGDGVPKAVGLLAASGPSKMNMAKDLSSLLSSDPTLAISIEPVGGSPTGQPTGPVVASGKLSAT